MPEPTFTDAQLRIAYTAQRDFWDEPQDPAEQLVVDAYRFEGVDGDQDTLIAVIEQLSRSKPEPYTREDLRATAASLAATYKNWEELGDQWLTDQYGEGLLEAHSSRIDVEGIGKDIIRDQTHLYLEGTDGRIYYFPG